MVSEEKIFENVDGRTDGRTTDAGVTSILIAHLGAFGSGELKTRAARRAHAGLTAIRDAITSPCCIAAYSGFSGSFFHGYFQYEMMCLVVSKKKNP